MTSEVVTFQADTPIREAVKTFVEKRISGAPVVDGSSKLQGIISESDVLWKESHGPESDFIIPPLYIGLFDTFVYLRDESKFKEQTAKALAKTVGEAMCKTVVTISPSASLLDAADLMLYKKVNRLPVCDESGTVVGMVTRSDVLRGMMLGACPVTF